MLSDFLNSLINYVKLGKPRIALLLAYTGFTTYLYASNLSNIVNAIIFFFLGFTACMGSNALNSYIDREIDRLMRRTRNRPIPKGVIKPTQALVSGLFMLLTSTLAFLILFNYLVAILVIVGAVYYVLFYTAYLKKRTPLNTIIGGLSGSIPTLTGWIAIKSTLSLEAILLALIVFLWTPGHFWCLAIKFKDDYIKNKLPMLPVIVKLRTALIAILVFNILTALAISSSIFFIGKFSYFITAFVSIVLLSTATIRLVINRS